MVLDAVGNSPMKVLFKAGNQEMRNGSWGSENPRRKNSGGGVEMVDNGPRMEVAS